VENPNVFDIPFPEIDWELFVNTGSFIKGIITETNGVIKSRKTTVVDIPLRVTFADLLKVFKSMENATEADYRIALGAKFDLPLVREKVFQLEHAGTFPVLRAPALSFRGIRVRNISLTRADFTMSWEVENKNSFAVDLKELTYSLAVNNSRWVAGTVPIAPRLPPGTKTLIPLDFSFNNLTMVRDITEIATKGTDVAYNCGGAVSLGGGPLFLRDVKIPFAFTGTTKLRK
jgi:LEA14-like dessication related protein